MGFLGSIGNVFNTIGGKNITIPNNVNGKFTFQFLTPNNDKISLDYTLSGGFYILSASKYTPYVTKIISVEPTGTQQFSRLISFHGDDSSNEIDLHAMYESDAAYEADRQYASKNPDWMIKEKWEFSTYGGDDVVKGSFYTDEINGGDGADSLYGDYGSDMLYGGNGNDDLSGGGGNDHLYGGSNTDVLRGGSGKDVFHFNSIKDSGYNTLERDVIIDFTKGSDKIDLSKIDANTAVSGNQGFSFIGDSDFSGKAGELRSWFFRDERHVEADVNGDGIGDFSFNINNVVLSASDFIL